MRVLHVIPSLDQRDGGPSVALPLMARGLAMHGMSVDVATTISDGDASRLGIPLGEPVERDSFTVRYFRRQTSFYKTSLPLLRWLGSHARDYALVHNHALFSFAPLAGARASRRSGVPYLMRPLGLLNTWGMENRRPWLKAASFRLLDRPALDHASAIHYTSSEEAREAARLHLRAKPVIVPLGIDLAPFRILPDKELFLARFPAARDRPLVLFLSRLDPKKGLELLLDSFAAVQADSPRAMLVIAGSGAPEYEAKLKAVATSLRLDSDVLWTGFLEGDDKLAALAAACIFVLPSYSENFGIALLEAMAAGLACISTDRVALAKECTEALQMVPCESEALRAALIHLLREEGARLSLGQLAASRARDLWSLEATGAQLAAVYRTIAR
jgi:glycosyltransferase involved in cell wall biosynthesis